MVDDRYALRAQMNSPPGAKNERPSWHVFRRPHQSIRFSRQKLLEHRVRSVLRCTDNALGY